MEVSYNSPLAVAQNNFATGGSARERAFAVIRDKIIYMDLKPGESLSDKILAEQLEMSRTPVREALIRLSAYNMVVLKPQSGTFVAPIDAEQLEIEQFSRLTMEKEIIKLACQNQTPELKWVYESNLRAYELGSKNDDPEKIRHLHEIDNNFHGLAFAATGKIKSYLHMHSYMQHIERLRVLTLIMKADNNINSDHTTIANAIVVGNERLAVETLEKHLNRYHESLELAKTQYPEYFVLG